MVLYGFRREWGRNDERSRAALRMRAGMARENFRAPSARSFYLPRLARSRSAFGWVSRSTWVLSQGRAERLCMALGLPVLRVDVEEIYSTRLPERYGKSGAKRLFFSSSPTLHIILLEKENGVDVFSRRKFRTKRE